MTQKNAFDSVRFEVELGSAVRKDATDFGSAQNRRSIGGGFNYYVPDVKTAIRKLFSQHFLAPPQNERFKL